MFESSMLSLKIAKWKTAVSYNGAASNCIFLHVHMQLHLQATKAAAAFSLHHRRCWQAGFSLPNKERAAVGAAHPEMFGGTEVEAVLVPTETGNIFCVLSRAQLLPTTVRLGTHRASLNRKLPNRPAVRCLQETCNRPRFSSAPPPRGQLLLWLFCSASPFKPARMGRRKRCFATH